MFTLLLSLALQAAQPPQGPPTIERYLALKQFENVSVAPDGRAVAFVVLSADLEKNAYRSELYLWRAARSELLAPGFTDARSPAWSRGGRWVSFLSGDTAVQLWLVPPAPGGVPFQLGPLQGKVLETAWGPESTLYALTLNGGREAYQIWRVPVPTGSPEYVWGSNRELRDLAASPDGGALAFAANSGSSAAPPSYDLRVLELGSRNLRNLTSRPGSELTPRWSPDGKTIAFLARKDPGDPRSQVELFTVPASGGRVTSLTDSFDRSVVEHRWSPSNEQLFSAAMGPYTHVFTVRNSGAIEALSSGNHNYKSFDVGPAGSPLYAVRESTVEAPELWRLATSRDEALTRFNRLTQAWTLGRQRLLRWIAPDGLSIEGLLIYPTDYREGERYPLLVHPRGGASDRIRDVLVDPRAYQLFAAQGYAVLVTGFRGSLGYGEAFATSRRDDLAGGELADMLAGIDHVVQLGIADSTRVALYGDGHGVRVTSRAVRYTPTFQATVIVTGTPSPLVERRGRGESSAAELSETELAGLRNTPTPVLFVRAAGAPNLAIESLYRLLRDQGRPVEYLQLPSEAAELRPRHRIELFFRQLRWYDRYLKRAGAESFDFYLAEEWAPGPHGWQLRVSAATVRPEYAGLTAEDGRYLELTLELQPDPANRRSAGDLRLDLGAGVQLLGPDGNPQTFAGTVTELFDRETLVLGTPDVVSVPAPRRGAPSALRTRMVYEVADQAAEYWLHVAGFKPIRIWLAGFD